MPNRNGRGPTPQTPPERNDKGQMLPQPLDAHQPSDGEPGIFAYRSGRDAQRMADALGPDHRVDTAKIDGRQVSVVQERIESREERGVSLEQWVTKPIPPGRDG